MKKWTVSIVALLLVLLMTACTDQSAEGTHTQPQKAPKTGFTAQEVQKAVNGGDVVVEQTSDDDNAFYDHEPNAIEVYNLKKIFAFEDNFDKKGEPSELKMTSFRKRLPTVTNMLSFDGKMIHYVDTWGSGNKYTCEDISTVKTGGDVELFHCVDKNGEKKSVVIILSDNRAHFLKVKDEYESELKKQ